NFFTGDMGRYYGTSFGGGVSVSNQLWKALPFSLVLILYAQVLALAVAIPLGVITAYRAGTRFDGASNAVAFGFLALPSYVLAFFLAIWVAVKWGLLPVSAAGKQISPVSDWRYMILPTISLAVAQIAVYMRLLRSDMIATLREDFITTAQAKGIPNRRILFRHALRPSSSRRRRPTKGSPSTRGRKRSRPSSPSRAPPRRAGGRSRSESVRGSRSAGSCSSSASRSSRRSFR